MACSARVRAPLRPRLRERFRPQLHAQQPPGPGASSSGSEGEPAHEVLSESELEEEGGGAPAGAARRRQEGAPPASWQRRVLQMPLEAAATLSKEDAHYLEKRGRSRWWKRAQFPRVPDEGRQAPPQLQVCGWVGGGVGAWGVGGGGACPAGGPTGRAHAKLGRSSVPQCHVPHAVVGVVGCGPAVCQRQPAATPVGRLVLRLVATQPAP